MKGDYSGFIQIEKFNDWLPSEINTPECEVVTTTTTTTTEKLDEAITLLDIDISDETEVDIKIIVQEYKCE